MTAEITGEITLVGRHDAESLELSMTEDDKRHSAGPISIEDGSLHFSAIDCESVAKHILPHGHSTHIIHEGTCDRRHAGEEHG